MATAFAYIPATSDGCTVLAPMADPENMTQFWAENNDWHPCSACGPDSSHEDINCAAQSYDEMPDGYGGFGAEHCANCGELAFNCAGACETVEPEFVPLAIHHCEACGDTYNSWMSCLCALAF